MRYEIIDHAIPEGDPETVQVLFADESEQEYVLTILYDVFYEALAPDPYTWSSDIDFHGYEHCGANVHSLGIHKYDSSKDAGTQHSLVADVEWGLGEPVDNICVDHVLSKEDWKTYQKIVEENYCEYVKGLQEDLV